MIHIHIPHTDPLYHPDLNEIRPLIQRVIDAWPHLKNRALDAEIILLNLAIRDSFGPQPLAGEWQVKSQNVRRVSEHWYYIDYAYGRATCECNDYQKGGGRADGRIFCKHSIAWLAYREILTTRLNYHIQASTITVERAGHSYLLNGYSMGVVKVEQDARYAWWTFAEPISLALFAHWLGGRQQARLEATVVAAKKERIDLTHFTDDPLRGEIHDAGIMNYAEWREQHG